VPDPESELRLPAGPSRLVGAVYLAARFGLPILGSVLLAMGGLWAVDLTQRTGVRALNLGSAALYALMIGVYGLASFLLRTWRRKGESVSDRAGRAGAEALLVGLVGSPVTFYVFALLFFEIN
jgi:hypothetical protein